MRCKAPNEPKAPESLLPFDSEIKLRFCETLNVVSSQPNAPLKKTTIDEEKMSQIK